jgi:predicted enzyme related to lactoylglutathione lyase
MSDPFVARVGAVFSADIAIPEHAQTLRFYSRVLTTGTHPLWREDLMNNLGMPIIGLGERTEDYAHLPIQWMPHIQVADVATSVQRALDLGGSVLVHARTEDGASQWAVLLDPFGAAFGIIPLVPVDAISQGAGDALPDTAPPMGRIYWLDLTVADAIAASDFYRQVVGWSVQSVEMNEHGERYTDCNLLADDGKPVARIRHARGVNAGLPPVWMMYLPVDDLAESLLCVEEEGGVIIKAEQREGGEYAYAAIRDPAGACFALIPG